MKKLLIIIVVLAIIFIGMLVYRSNGVNKSQVNINEINSIEEYIGKIYMWKEVTNEALPSFDNINDANETWIWEVVKKNLEEYEVDYNTIENKAKEIFGENFTKEFPKEGNQSFEYNEGTKKYIATEVNLDMQEDSFLLNTIEKENGKYKVQIVEYLEDYGEEESIIIRNLQGEEIGRIANSESETKAQEIIKKNIDRFTKKNIILKNEENLVVEKVENG